MGFARINSLVPRSRYGVTFINQRTNRSEFLIATVVKSDTIIINYQTGNENVFDTALITCRI